MWKLIGTLEFCFVLLFPLFLSQEVLESMLSKKNLVKDQFLASKMNPQMCAWAGWGVSILSWICLSNSSDTGTSQYRSCFYTTDCRVWKQQQSRWASCRCSFLQAAVMTSSFLRFDLFVVDRVKRWQPQLQNPNALGWMKEELWPGT